MSSDILQKLKSEYAAQEDIVRAAKESMRELRLAIAAIEGHRSSIAPVPPADDEVPAKRNKRGLIARLVLDSIRNGRGVVRLIQDDCRGQGVDVSANSISNAISRLKGKGQIRWDVPTDRWALARGSQPELECSPGNAEGPDMACASEPSHMNGTAGVYPAATALHTAGA